MDDDGSVLEQMAEDYEPWTAMVSIHGDWVGEGKNVYVAGSYANHAETLYEAAACGQIIFTHFCHDRD